ncbi:hypothetical protein GUITHDRAFT_160406 [Guillardia theta CCMP2712]|uniref:LysM domain-containing protein n=1 Tax=Guillardia theta (strain CCMP2712) TaxID=905079 RepID=L1K426_GUITC|nr:hypothetical protein GUITHDRAFT_160406 [Guillardia theta CCMP2712]EKX55225.1 hypothetical protein GUITHDRAFT_160406 [Guillardia theta CCMP2712]|eukprot:XP_005842205.1 hypothetical protein GUITHDRAFT_160406 [Guillardia theta CCMP2712]
MLQDKLLLLIFLLLLACTVKADSWDRDNTMFFCKYLSTSSSNYLHTEALYISSSELICKMPEWGNSYKADLTYLSIWKGASFASSTEILAIGDPVEIYFSESIVSISPHVLISPSSLITVVGAGFDTSVSYHIVFVPKVQFSAMASPPTTQQWIYSFVLNVTNNTYATSMINWNHDAGDHFVTLFRDTSVNKSLLFTSYNGIAVQDLSPRKDITYGTPEWSESVVASNAILEEGLECGKFKLDFHAEKGMGPLRLTLKYTPLRPKILRTTDVMPSREYTNSLEGDYFDADGIYYPGPSDTVLDLPLQTPAVKQTKADIVASQTLKIPDNLAEPSHMIFSCLTDFQNGNVSGTVEWNVSKGWEGFAYKLCVTAYHAVVPLASRSLDLANERCFFVIVPKCSKCLTAVDTLDSVSAFYGANWIDLWSSNHQMFKTKSVDVKTDEVFNAPNDRVYIEIDRNTSLKLGQSYRMNSGDTINSVSLRFGMMIENFLALNPDIFAGNEFQKLDGKRVCILSSTSKYSTCTETPSPIFYEATYRARFYHDFDVKGRPIKTYNDRYPQPPFEFPPKTP